MSDCLFLNHNLLSALPIYLPVYLYIFCISNPNNVKLGTITHALKFEIHQTNGSRDKRVTDTQTDRHSCNL